MPLQIPAKSNTKFLAPSVVNRMLLPNGPVQFTFERMKKSNVSKIGQRKVLHNHETEESLLILTENFRAIINLSLRKYEQ